MTAIRSVVLGCGSYLPERILTNAELASRIDTSDEWIVQRTGIRERHVAAEGEFTSHLAIKAARAALHHARLDAQAIDLIVLATSTPDNTFPATAVAVQFALQHLMPALTTQYGTPIGESGKPQEMLVVGMGKLGGGELNVSSDIDLIFAFDEDGETDGAKPVSNAGNTSGNTTRFNTCQRSAPKVAAASSNSGSSSCSTG